MVNRTYITRKLNQIGMQHAQTGSPSIEAAIRYLQGEQTLADMADNYGLSIDSSNYSSVHSRQESPSGGRLASERYLANTSASDTSSSDIDTRVTIGMVGYKVKSALPDTSKALPSIGKDNSSVPYPRLCGASFSMTGKLACFFSPIPHPSASSFSTFAFTTRKEQPILQSRKFKTQPKTFTVWENYRAFLLSQQQAKTIETNDRSVIKSSRERFDFWLDDVDIDDPEQLLTKHVHKNVSSCDLLARLNRQETQSPRHTATSLITKARRLRRMSTNSIGTNTSDRGRSGSNDNSDTSEKGSRSRSSRGARHPRQDLIVGKLADNSPKSSPFVPASALPGVSSIQPPGHYRSKVKILDCEALVPVDKLLGKHLQYVFNNLESMVIRQMSATLIHKNHSG